MKFKNLKELESYCQDWGYHTNLADTEDFSPDDEWEVVTIPNPENKGIAIDALVLEEDVPYYEGQNQLILECQGLSDNLASQLQEIYRKSQDDDADTDILVNNWNELVSEYNEAVKAANQYGSFNELKKVKNLTELEDAYYQIVSVNSDMV